MLLGRVQKNENMNESEATTCKQVLLNKNKWANSRGQLIRINS